MFDSVEDVQKRLLDQGYISSKNISTVVYLAAKMNKPVLVEEQVVIIFAGVRGYLDKLPINKVEVVCNAIRGTEKIFRTPFEVGLHYMEFTEAEFAKLSEAQRIAPGYALIYQYRSNVAYLMGDKEAAARALREGLKIEPDNALFQENLRQLERGDPAPR